jgi:hypothetical protein
MTEKLYFPGDLHRENNGDWIILIGEGDDRRRFGTIAMQAKAKRGDGWKTPDPAGEAMARRLVELWNKDAGQ